MWETGKGGQHQRNGRSQVLSAWASITKYQSCQRLTQHVLVSGGWKSGIKGRQDLPPVCDDCRLAGCSHDLFFVQVLEGGGGERESSGVSS